MKMSLLPIAVVMVILLLSISLAGAQETQTLTVFAAASLTDAFTEIGEAFAEAHPGVALMFNFGNSSALATQLAEGAAADVFASANTRQMEVAQAAGRIAEPVQIFARNQLVIAVPADNPADIESLADLANPGVLLVLAAPEVPVRVYTEAMLEALAAVPEYGEAYREAVLANVVSEEETVRQVVAKIALGEADVGIVYQSDVTPDVADDVLAIEIPDEFNQIATYPIAAISDSANPELAQAFVAFVLSDAGQEIIVRWGFAPRCPDDPEIEATPEVETAETPAPEETPDAAGCE
jgi:molybdate transport system substrate-binding protein